MRVKLYNWEIEIVEVKKLELSGLAENNLTMGQWETEKMTVTLREDLRTDIKRMVLIHELTHAIIDLMGYGVLTEENYCKFMGANLDVIHNIVEVYFK